MAEAKRPDGKRRSPTSGPGRIGEAPGKNAGRPRTSKTATSKTAASKTATSKTATAKPASAAPKGEPRATEERELPAVIEPIRQSIAESAEQQSEQRLGFTARRAAILAAVVCVLTLTIAGPVRTYFAQRTEMSQLAATEEALRAQISELEQQKQKLADPAFIAAQARERLGFVMPGDIPYQVQLPPSAASAENPGGGEQLPGTSPVPEGPWYSALWKTIADEPHGPPQAVPAPPPPPGAPPGVPAPPLPAGG
jgi:uncharacterized protein